MMKLTLLLALVAVANCINLSKLPGLAKATDIRITYSYVDGKGNSIELELDEGDLKPALKAPAPAPAAPAPAPALAPAARTAAHAPARFFFIDDDFFDSSIRVAKPAPKAAPAPAPAPVPRAAPAPVPAPPPRVALAAVPMASSSESDED